MKYTFTIDLDLTDREVELLKINEKYIYSKRSKLFKTYEKEVMSLYYKGLYESNDMVTEEDYIRTNFGDIIYSKIKEK